MELCILASSSAGNSIAIRNESGIVLIDVGLSARAVEASLHRVGWDSGAVRAVLLSHEHSDHTRGVGAFVRRYKVPVYATQGTLEAIKDQWRGQECLNVLEVGSRVQISGMTVESYSVPHDVTDPSQFVIRNGRVSLGIATDLGTVTSLVRQKLRTVDLAIVEANHDADRLRQGNYPWNVKQRVGSTHGHLDNSQAAELVLDLAREGVPHIVLAHLSPRHNDVEQVERAMAKALAGLTWQPLLTVVGPHDGTPVISVIAKAAAV
jgi:phosphoribosyl 1,2-cyclic phosphodiesterase